MKCFVSNYHISVNRTLVDDLVAIGLDVIMPDKTFEKTHIWFYAPNDEHQGKPRVQLVSYNYFIGIEEPMVLLIPCMQMIDDIMKLYQTRGERDVIVYLTANSDAERWFDLNGVDYLMTHDLDFHRKTTAKYKMLYFSKPTVLIPPKDEKQLRTAYNGKKLKLYINNFDKEGFEPEYASALELRKLWLEATGWRIPFYGYGMEDGWLSMQETQSSMVDSMFSVVFKRRDTWGQMVNESMMLGTPCIFRKEYIYSTFKEYLINDDTAIVGQSNHEIVDRLLAMTFEQYETLVNESFSQSHMFCNDDIRQDKLRWLFDKVSKDAKMVV